MLISLSDLLTSPVVQGTLHQVAVVGNLVAPSKEWETVQALAVTLGSKSIVALCLVLRVMLQQTPDGDPPLSRRAVKCIQRVFAFMEQFCFLTSGLGAHQMDPFADDVAASGETVPDQGLPYVTGAPPPEVAPSQAPQPLNVRSASVPDLRSAIAAYTQGGEGGPALGSPEVEEGAPSRAADSEAGSAEKEVKLDKMARLCGVPESILSAEGFGCPSISGQAVLAAGETAKVWRWVYKINEAWNEAVETAIETELCGAPAVPNTEADRCAGPSVGEAAGLQRVEQLIGRGWDSPITSLLLLKPRQETGSIHLRGPVDARVFNYEGACSIWSSRMLHRFLETPLRWALRRDALHLLCIIVSLCPDMIMERLYRYVLVLTRGAASGFPRGPSIFRYVQKGWTAQGKAWAAR